jgi:uncharacterized RDD family membrane protein YckC
LIVGVRVIDADDGARVGWLGSALRWLLPALPVSAVALLEPSRIVQLLLFVIWIAVYLPILWDPRGQGLHDRVAHTTVVRHRAQTDGSESEPII